MTGFLYWTGVVVAFCWFGARARPTNLDEQIEAITMGVLAALLWPVILGAWVAWRLAKLVGLLAWRHRVWIWRKTRGVGRGAARFYSRRRPRRVRVEYHPDAQLARVAHRLEDAP